MQRALRLLCLAFVVVVVGCGARATGGSDTDRPGAANQAANTDPDAGAAREDAGVVGEDAGVDRDDEEVDPAAANARSLAEAGQEIFRFDTFGSEAFWGDLLGLHLALAGEALGGVGPGVSPESALALGLKVDVDALPQELRDALAAGEVDLTDPATTLVLLQQDAVLGVRGFFEEEAGDDGARDLESVGITCALCHSTVDDSFAPGIG